jgi:hypothetical protein
VGNCPRTPAFLVSAASRVIKRLKQSIGPKVENVTFRSPVYTMTGYTKKGCTKGDILLHGTSTASFD